MKQLSIALVTVFALAACSGTANTSSSDAAASTTPAARSAPFAAATTTIATGDVNSACALVKLDEASKALGSKVISFVAKTDHDGYSSCRYYDATKTKNVFVQFVDPKLADAMAAMGGKDVAGVGDRGTWLAGSIFVQKAGKAAQVGLYLSAASMKAMDPAEVDLAKVAAGRM